MTGGFGFLIVFYVVSDSSSHCCYCEFRISNLVSYESVKTSVDTRADGEYRKTGLLSGMADAPVETIYLAISGKEYAFSEGSIPPRAQLFPYHRAVCA